MTCGDWPFKGGSEYLIFKSTMDDELAFPPYIFSDDLKDLLLQILQKEEGKRLPLEDILKHPFFTSYTKKPFNEIKPSQSEK